MSNIPNQYDTFAGNLIEHFLADGRIDAAERRLLGDVDTLAVTAAVGLAVIRTGSVPRRFRRDRPGLAAAVNATIDATA